VDRKEIQQALLARGVRIEPEMADYVARRLLEQKSQERMIPLLGGDARTGVPIRTTISRNELTK